MKNQKFNPAAEEFSFGEEVSNKKTKQNGVVVSVFGTLVQVRYYEKDGLTYHVGTTSMQDLINDSAK